MFRGTGVDGPPSWADPEASPFLRGYPQFQAATCFEIRIPELAWVTGRGKATPGVTNAVDVAPPSAVGLACVWHPQLDQDPGRSGTGWIRRRQVLPAGRLGPNQVPAVGPELHRRVRRRHCRTETGEGDS